MREELTIDLTTGERRTRRYTTEENNAVEEAGLEWRRRAEQRQKDIEVVKAHAEKDPVFAALLRVLGVM